MIPQDLGFYLLPGGALDQIRADLSKHLEDTKSCSLISTDEHVLCGDTFCSVGRPEGCVHPPAAGLDPQLAPGGAEVVVPAGGLGQDVSAALRLQQANATERWKTLQQRAQDCGWKKFGVLAPPVAADLHNALERQRKTKTCNQFFFVFANECLADKGALTLTADAVYDFMAVANQVGIWCGQSHFLLCTSRYFYITSMTYKYL